MSQQPDAARERSPGGSLRRTLHSLRSPFRAGSPFHLGAIKRTPSTKSASDSESTRDARAMRKKGKKRSTGSPAHQPAAPAEDAPPSPAAPDKKKKEGFLRRMGSIGKRRGDESQSRDYETASTSLETAPTPPLVDSEPDAEPPAPEPVPIVPAVVSTKVYAASPPEPASPIAVEHPVATRPFMKATWQRRSNPEMEKPVETPSPGSSLRRRITTVSVDEGGGGEEGEGADGEDDAGGGVASLEEAVRLARARLAPAHSAEEETFADAMPPAPYGDILAPPTPPVSAAKMPLEETPDADCVLLSVCECCGISNETHHLVATQSTPNTERREHLYKILVIGELGTGKTSIIKRYVHQFFSQHYRATIGVDFALKVLNWDANTVIRLQLWDIAGQERFGNMTRVYYKEAVGAFIVFDVSRVATFDAVVKWKSDLDAKVQLPDGSPIPCILLANKCDQQKEGIVNTPSKMDEYCREKGFAGWFETSAKENINIEEAARSLVNKILLNDKLLHNNDKDAEKFGLDHRIANGENSPDSDRKTCAC